VKKQFNANHQQRGYSIVELLVSVAVISILSAIGVPSLVRTYRSYQMDDIAGQVAAQLKFTRYEAIRRNCSMNILNKTQNAVLTMFTDGAGAGCAAGNGNLDASEKRILFPATGVATLVDSGAVSGASGVPAAAQVAALTTVSPTNGSVTFDSRGAKTAPAGAIVYWVGNAGYGWRAVTVMPSGSIQVWTNVSGTWRQLS